ncbi:ATP synthase subunit I [Halomonas sp. THAF12]|uniref:ATP synthase protein I n=1 Tax=Halomonas organivorans TaxID=257772 RepID=A0A7W5BYZ8_9GAMM|nr:F0F1 ATP synthase subunit I [Halomonas organivorans]MBB3141734.1 ATP synthase protein I [Halomonas organivorans]
MAARIKRPSVRRLLLVQFGMVCLASLLGAWSEGGPGALSALLGGAVAFLPNAFFTWRVFRYQGARHTRNIVNGFYRAEAGKFGLTAALFTLVFIAVPPSNPAFFFGAYVVTLFVHWLGPWLLRRPSHT